MKHYSNRRVSLLAAALMIPAGLTAQTRRPVIQGVIDTPGSYTLLSDIGVSPNRGPGILITASGVDLDLAGSNIVGPGGIQGTGIHVRGVSGVAIRNGKLANLAFGVIVEASSNVTVRDCHFRGEGLAPSAPPPETAVMIMQSRNVIVENNAISNTGLGIFVRGGRSGGNKIANNTITAGLGTFAALGICYNPTAADPQAPKGDLIQGNFVSGYPTSIQMNANSSANVIKGNTLVYGASAIDGLGSNVEMDNVKVKYP
ncbi:MAG: right-handed parallel beta-helix repeat-containing protein [Bryobacteraceae bacterium]